MTQTEFAELFELKRTALGSYEEGRAEAKTDTLIRIANHFRISLDQLLRKEITVNEIFHFPDTEKGGDIYLINSADVTDYLTRPDIFDFKIKARRINSALFHHSATAAFVMPFSDKILDTRFAASDIVFLSDARNKSNLFAGIYKDELCLASCQNDDTSVITAEGLISLPDLSVVTHKKSVVQVLHSFLPKRN